MWAHVVPSSPPTAAATLSLPPTLPSVSRYSAPDLIPALPSSQALLYDMLYAVPLEALDRKVAALLRRIQDVMIHACIIGTARMKLPKYFGKSKTKVTSHLSPTHRSRPRAASVPYAPQPALPYP